jgi:hypothetical protein
MYPVRKSQQTRTSPPPAVCPRTRGQRGLLQISAPSIASQLKGSPAARCGGPSKLARPPQHPNPIQNPKRKRRAMPPNRHAANCDQNYPPTHHLTHALPKARILSTLSSHKRLSASKDSGKQTHEESISPRHHLRLLPTTKNYSNPQRPALRTIPLTKPAPNTRNRYIPP